MPSNHEERISFIRDVLASRIAASVLPRFEELGTVLQKDLVNDLSHSNKSILRYLETLRSYDLVTTGSKIEKGKRVVYHELTKSGWVLVRFYSEGLPADVRELTESLLEDYLTSLLHFYREQNLEESVFFEILTRARSKSMLEGSPSYPNPDFMVLGASSLFTSIHCDALTNEDLEVSCRIPSRFAGGSSLELAVHLADQNNKVVFISSIGDDLNGWEILASLISHGIDVRHFVIEPKKQTNQTILIDDGINLKRLVGIDEGFSLSISSPSQIPWDLIKKSKIVYLGEVFLEIAMAVAAYCKANMIPTVFRCSQHYWKLGLTRIAPLLNQVGVLIISPVEWEIAEGILGSKPIAALRKHTDAGILIKMNEETYGLVHGTSSEIISFKLPTSSDDFDPLFVSRFISYFRESSDIEASFLHCMKGK